MDEGIIYSPDDIIDVAFLTKRRRSSFHNRRTVGRSASNGMEWNTKISMYTDDHQECKNECKRISNKAIDRDPENLICSFFK